MPSCIHCGGRGEVYDDTCGAWEPCPVKCEAWFRVLADDAVLESLEMAYVPEEEDQDGNVRRNQVHLPVAGRGR